MHLIVPIVYCYYNIGSECKERWESLRSQYRKNENKQKTKSGQAASNISNWKYASQMHFLKQFMKDRSRVTSMTTTTSNDSDEEKSDESTNDCEIEANNNEQTNENNNEENVDEDVDKEVTQTSSLKTPKLRKKITHTDYTKESASTTLMKYLVQQKREEQPPHPIDTFFSLMATSVKKFNATDQHFVKTQLFSLVSDIEAKYIESQNRRNFQPEFIHGRSLQSPAFSQYSALSTSSSYNDNSGPNQQQINPIQTQPQVYPENTQTFAMAFANDFNQLNK